MPRSTAASINLHEGFALDLLAGIGASIRKRIVIDEDIGHRRWQR